MGLERGTVIGRIGRPGDGPYQLQERIGAGRDTEVWRAESLQSGQTVAIKIYPRWYGADRGYVQRFMRTTRASQQGQHPGLLPLIEAGEDDGHTFLVTPLIEGGSLEERLDGRPWTLAAAIALLEPLAAAIDVLHAQGVVHGNLKPSNVLLDDRVDGDDGVQVGASRTLLNHDHRVARPLLTDPLVVRPVAASNAPGQFDLLLGSPTYASPEQASGTSLDTGPASDRYSLGVLAYELLTGRPPFVEEAPLSLLLDHIVKLPPAACALNPELPPAVERSLTVMLAKDPDRRFPTGAAFVASLRSAQETAVIRPRPLPVAARVLHATDRVAEGGQARTVSSPLLPVAARQLQVSTSWQCRLAWSAP